MRFKLLLLFLVLLIAPAGLFWSDVSRALEMRRIKQAPAYAVAKSSHLVVGAGNKKRPEPMYYVHYKFVVDGAEYVAQTTPTDRDGALRYMSEPSVPIVYLSGDPSTNTLGRYYDLRRDDSLAELLFIVTVPSISFALACTLLVGWSLSKLRKVRGEP